MKLESPEGKVVGFATFVLQGRYAHWVDQALSETRTDLISREVPFSEIKKRIKVGCPLGNTNHIRHTGMCPENFRVGKGMNPYFDNHIVSNWPKFGASSDCGHLYRDAPQTLLHRGPVDYYVSTPLLRPLRLALWLIPPNHS